MQKTKINIILLLLCLNNNAQSAYINKDKVKITQVKKGTCKNNTNRYHDSDPSDDYHILLP